MDFQMSFRCSYYFLFDRVTRSTLIHSILQFYSVSHWRAFPIDVDDSSQLLIMNGTLLIPALLCSPRANDTTIIMWMLTMRMKLRSFVTFREEECTVINSWNMCENERELFIRESSHSTYNSSSKAQYVTQHITHVTPVHVHRRVSSVYGETCSVSFERRQPSHTSSYQPGEWKYVNKMLFTAAELVVSLKVVDDVDEHFFLFFKYFLSDLDKK